MDKIEREKRVVEYMIRLYCKKKEGNQMLCIQCKELIEYAQLRLDCCKFGNGKPTCRLCTIHCYKKDMKEKICLIMKYSGPRIFLYHPIAAIRHIIDELSSTPKSRVEKKKNTE